ncbi:MAG: sigma factor-like helix-turn-helix DNA-binding protein, partial [Quisquiliibacterium sp.]
LHQAAVIDLEQSQDPVAALARQRMHDELIRQVEQLPDSLREVFLLQVVQGLPTAEVCARLGITEANCWVRLHRARKRLCERMREHRD